MVFLVHLRRLIPMIPLVLFMIGFNLWFSRTSNSLKKPKETNSFRNEN